jgi:hypothetical protein
MTFKPSPPQIFSEKLKERIRPIYEEAMWLAKRKKQGVTVPYARYWANHRLGHMALHVRLFTGYVSQVAIDKLDKPLVLEHHGRIATTVTDLLEDHVTRNLDDSAAFIALIEALETVHIVTDEENHDARTHKGDYVKAGITLVAWNQIDRGRQQTLFEAKIKGKVSNWRSFRPGSNLWAPPPDEVPSP